MAFRGPDEDGPQAKGPAPADRPVLRLIFGDQGLVPERFCRRSLGRGGSGCCGVGGGIGRIDSLKTGGEAFQRHRQATF